MTNNLKERLHWHRYPGIISKHFTTKYKCYYLIYFEHYQDVDIAIQREKQLKGWKRDKKENLIKEFNPEWRFLNDEIYAVIQRFLVILSLSKNLNLSF